MDKVDAAIIKEMISPHSFNWNIRVPLDMVAKKAGVDEDTVRARLRKLNLREFLKRWELVVNPSLLGLKGAAVEVALGADSSKDRLVSDLKLIEGVRWVWVYHKESVMLVLFYNSEQSLKRRLDLIASLAAASPIWWRMPIFPCEIKLSRTDWQIIRSLRKDPRKSYTSVAGELKISTRTVRRRVKSMSDGRAFFLDPVIELSKIRGGISCDVRVSYAEGANHKELHQVVLSKLENVVWANGDSPTSMFVVFCDNAAKLDDLAKSIRVLNRVKEVRADIQTSRFTIDDWFDEQIERKLAES